MTNTITRNVLKDLSLSIGQPVKVTCGANDYDGTVTGRSRTGHRVEVEQAGTVKTFTRRRGGYYVEKGCESVYLFVREEVAA